MKYRRTQILLDQDEHRRLTREAAARGISLAALIRERLSASRGVAENAPDYRARSWDAIFGMISVGPDRDFDDPDEEVHEAFAENYERKMGRR